MELTFWGVRGSIPAPGPATLRYGGNTACVSVRLQSGALVVFDCGTGARNLGNHLCTQAFGDPAVDAHATLALSISQWDHIQGFPFFRPFFVPKNRFTIYGPTAEPLDLEQALEGQMAAQYFPVQTIKNMAAAIDLRALLDGESVDVGGARLSSVTLAGPPVGLGGDGRLGTRAFRLEEGGQSLVYAGHTGSGVPASALPLFENASLLIHECTFSSEDWQRYPHRGLASLDHALDTALRSNARKLALFHYDQDYSDQEVDALLARARAVVAEKGAALEILAAAELTTIAL